MAKTKKQTGKQTIVTQDIIIRSPQRSASDVSRWRSALISADAGRPKALFDLYEDLLIDGVLSDAVDKRIKAVLNSELIFQQDGEIVQEITDLMDTLEWEDLITEIMKCQFYGRSGIEFLPGDGFQVAAIPPKHISLETRSILINDTDPSGIAYEGDRTLLILGKPRNWGLYLKTAPFAIWKRGGFGDYAQWLEIFGMPQRIGKYSSYDPQSRMLLEEALKKAGSAPWLVIPKESDVETVNNTGSGSSGTSYNDFRKACNEELLITVQGQTLTTIQGDKGARSLGDVHKDVAEALHKADMRFVEKVLNTYVRAYLDWKGLPVSTGKFVFPDIAEPLTVADIVLLSEIIRIPSSFVYNKYGIPVPKDSEEIAGKQPAPADDPDPDPKPKPKQKEKEPEPDDVKNSDRITFLDHVLSFFVAAPTLRSGANRNFTTRLRDNITGTITLDDYSFDIDAIVEEAIREIYEEEGNPLVNRHLFNITNNALQHAIDTTLSGANDTDYVERFKENAAVFAAFKNHQQTEEIAALIRDEKGKLKPFYKFKKEALRVSQDYNVNWLQTEYNTAVQAARTASNMIRFRETAHLYPNLEYIRSSAAHPRVSHLRYAGTILPIDHPWWSDHLPPSDWNCQCSVRQTDKEPTGVPDGEGDEPAFTHDLMTDAEFVKIDETAYYKGCGVEVREEIKEIAKEFVRIGEETVTETYKGKEGGFLDIVYQNSIERAKNLVTYKYLADRGGKYTLLSETNIPGVKNPDAFNFVKGVFSDAKHPETTSGKAAIQNSIKKAAEQKVSEVVIRLDMDYPVAEIYDGFKAALQGNRAKVIKEIILIRKGKNPIWLDAEKLRTRFVKK